MCAFRVHVCMVCVGVCVPAALLEECKLQSSPLQHGQGGDCDWSTGPGGEAALKTYFLPVRMDLTDVHRVKVPGGGGEGEKGGREREEGGERERREERERGGGRERETEREGGERGRGREGREGERDRREERER